MATRPKTPDPPDPNDELEMRRRLSRAYTQMDRARFTGATFIGYLAGYKGDLLSGEMEIRIRIPINEKDHAWSLTDATRQDLLFDVKPITRKAYRERAASEAESPKEP